MNDEHSDDSTPEELLKAEEATEEEQVLSTGCGILGRYPVASVLCFALVGIGIGIGLSYWEPDDPNDKSVAIKWIGLVGDLFIRALKCIVLPLVFVNVVISVADMVSIGKAGSVGWKTIGLYLLTTALASVWGIISIVSFKSLFDQGSFEPAGPATIMLGCSTDGSLLTEQADGSIVCMANPNPDDATFVIENITGGFQRSSGDVRSDISLSDTVYDGVFTKLVTSNIIVSFNEDNFAAVVFFAIFFGLSLASILDRGRIGQNESTVMSFLKELDVVFITLINWIILATPFAVMSLITAAVGSQTDLKESFANVGYLVVATIIAMILQVSLVYVIGFFLVTRSNPFVYLRHMIPAQTMAFACASSAATIPMTLKCVKSTGRVPDSVARFVIPLGATVNMDGGAIYFPCACIWLAVLNGIEPDIASYFLLVIISTIGSAGTAPVPSASLVLIITAYNTVFNTTGIPEGFSFILAIDWFMDRLRTVVNVTGDTIVAGAVSHLCGTEEMQQMEDAGVVQKGVSSGSNDETFEEDAQPISSP